MMLRKDQQEEWMESKQTLRNFSMESLATSKSVGRAPRYVRCDMDALVSTRNRMMVILMLIMSH